MSISLSLVGQVNVTDNQSGTSGLSKQLSAVTTIGTSYGSASPLTISTTPVSIFNVGATPANFLYIKNLHASNTITLIWTPQGGASATILTLQPGAVLVFSNPSGSTGISAVTVTGSAPGTTLEYVIGA